MTHPLLMRFSDMPALIEPGHISHLDAAVTAIANHPRSEALFAETALSADDGFWFSADDWRSAYRPYVVRDGVLHIPVKGILLSDFPWALGSWATGYEYIGRALDRGLADGNVRGIALIVNSYGGQGQGCFDLSNRIFAGRGVKPILGFASMAYSAGYAVVSAAQKVTISDSSGIGSIGVVMTHLDQSRALENAGLKYTFIHFGKHKVDGNSTEPLPADVAARWQQWCDTQGMQFCELVARNRGMPVDKVQATEAGCYLGAEGKAIGLADAIAPLDEAVTEFNPDQSDVDDDQTGEADMSGSVPAAGAAAATAAIDAARNEGHATGKAEGHAAGKADGVKEGATAERTRIGAILGCEEAKSRTSLAHHLAFETDMNAQASKSLLGKSATEAKTETKNPLDAAMSGVENPKVGADASADQSDDAKATALASSIVSAYRGKATTAAN